MDQEWGLCSPFEIIYKSYATYQQRRNIIRNSLTKKNTVNIGYDQQQRIHMCRPLMQKP